MEHYESSEPKLSKGMRVRRILGRILPFVDPVKERYDIWPSGRPPATMIIRSSGRIVERQQRQHGIGGGGLYLPSPELEPIDLWPGDWERAVARGEVEPSTPNTETLVEPNSLNNPK